VGVTSAKMYVYVIRQTQPGSSPMNFVHKGVHLLAWLAPELLVINSRFHVNSF